jgi:SAM-dependent methyltransferase
MKTELNYGNWIRLRVLWGLGLSAVAMGILGALPITTWVRVPAIILFVVLLVSFLFPLYAYTMFSPRGGNLQDQLYDLTVKNLGKDMAGSVLDIGSGNGILAIKLARAFPNVRVTGVDYWGRNWEYSKAVCDENARLAGVGERVEFHKGDAAALDAGDSTFDGVVSNLTFHEVRSSRRKSEVVGEALRVLKPGGRFAFVDMFYDSKFYGDISEFEAFLKSLGLSEVTLRPLREVIILPKLLLHPKILGRAGVVWGQK